MEARKGLLKDTDVIPASMFRSVYMTDSTVAVFVINDIETFVANQLDDWIVEFLSLLLRDHLENQK